ncbi:tRNA methyltransferase complex GCD14 subunit-domain-containing protein [Flagelloscypha sp. PMI_526]|nr:tRNA methyltransferase complex GCD14 subunit-domain-containing protein [Flagelloscypha sp. PMI_526]
MFSTSREIEDGDIVIIWQTREAIQPLLITAGSELQSKFGYYRHSDLIGLPYGSKVGSRNGKGFIHVLRPTPELWTMALPHRTQILYLADIALITSYLHVTRGSIVIEAGEAFFRSCLKSHRRDSRVNDKLDPTSRTVGSVGKVFSYEFHEQRADKAREEFNQHGMADIVTLTHRNVCKDGFTVEDEADAVFLDLPAPWDAVEHAKKALRKNVPSRICCFSPCMEQVIRTVNALNEAGFTDITMYETLSRPMDIQQVPDPLPLSTLVQRLKSSEKRREDKRQRQIASSRARYEPQKGKRKREDGSATTQGTANSVSSAGTFGREKN